MGIRLACDVILLGFGECLSRYTTLLYDTLLYDTLLYDMIYYATLRYAVLRCPMLSYVVRYSGLAVPDVVCSPCRMLSYVVCLDVSDNCLTLSYVSAYFLYIQFAEIDLSACFFDYLKVEIRKTSIPVASPVPYSLYRGCCM